MRLLVVEPFGDYSKGDQITDAKEVRRALASNPDSVLRVAEPRSGKAPQATPDPLPAEVPPSAAGLTAAEAERAADAAAEAAAARPAEVTVRDAPRRA